MARRAHALGPRPAPSGEPRQFARTGHARSSARRSELRSAQAQLDAEPGYAGWWRSPHPWLGDFRWYAAEPACCLPAAMTGFDGRDGSLLSVLSVGCIFLTPISGSAAGRVDRPLLASQLVHSFAMIRTTFGRLRRRSR